jgi:Arylsulfotransferase (ASST)
LITRRQLLRSGGVAAGLLATGGNALGAVQRASVGRSGAPPGSASNQQVLRFRSQPNLLPPADRVSVASRHAAPGYLFMGPQPDKFSQSGTMIVDEAGEPIFFQPVSVEGQWATNVGVQTYNDKPVLVWWEGKLSVPGYGRGTAVILDQSYRRLARVRAAQDRWIDLHELQLTPQGTALFTCHPATIEADLSSVGGPKSGQIVDPVFQEIDLRTGRLLLEWRGLDHISISESYEPISKPWDYLHLNSIDVLPDGNLLVGCRQTFALYKLDRRTGNVIWRLGGKRSDFDMGPGTQFAWQHDGRQVGSSTITVFDDGSEYGSSAPQSRGLMLNVDFTHKTVRIAHQYFHPQPLLSVACGNVQVLADGHVVVGWGTVPFLSEFTADGKLLFDLQLPGPCQSYRGFRFPWTGVPAHRPAIATTSSRSSGETVLYASWNGATTVAKWEILSGSSPKQLGRAKVVSRRGFETAIMLGRASGYVAVAALDASGRRLATSAVTKV